MSENLLDRARWWTAPGSVDDALAYFRAHSPIGRAWSGGGYSVEITSGNRTLEWLSSGDGTYSSPELLIAVIPWSDGVAVSANAQLVWSPTRQSAAYVPDTVTDVTLTVVREDPAWHRAAPTVQVTLGRDAARRLAAVVNSLEVKPPMGPQSCPMSGGERLFDQLDFRPTASMRVIADLAGCTVTTVSSRGTTVAVLDDHGTLDRAVLEELELPQDYGR